MTTLDDIKRMSAYMLAQKEWASCSDPDSKDSPGAKLLLSVRDVIVEAVESQELDVTNEDTWDSTIQETADGAPSVYTYTMWQEFVDLGGYFEDPTDVGADAGDMSKAAAMCLYMIAERLCRNLLNALAEGRSR